MKDLKYELSRLPDSPGVYLMKDKDGNIIYVGKAKNLKNRVRSYFNSDSGKSRKVIKMVEKIDHFEYIIVDKEAEALVLESNFIKEHRPHYNILLRDDKQYPYIMLTNEEFPRIEKVRQVKKDGNEYFGPYPNAYAVNDVIRLLQNIFRLRLDKNIQSYGKNKRPPLKQFLYKYNDPDHDFNDMDQYMKNVEKVRTFLKGNPSILTDILEEKMYDYSKNLEFERALEYKNYIESVDSVMERQKVSSVRADDLDIVSMAKAKSYVTIQVFFMRANVLNEMYHPKKLTPAVCEFTDIAGLVKGASKGEGLGNQFLSYIRNCDAILEVVRCFEDSNVTHVEGGVDPIRDAEIINLELILADLETVEKRIPKIEKKAQSKVDDAPIEYQLLKRIR